MERIARTSIRPGASLDLLSHREIDGLLASNKEVYQLFRRCALAVLNTGNEEDDARQLMDRYQDFSVKVVPQSRGLKLEIYNAPASAFVDGIMIAGIREHLFSALRDIVYTHHKITRGSRFDLRSSAGITDAVFRIARNANVVRPHEPPSIVVCWGGHSISRREYDYSKEVGYQLGLRGLNIATGCGIGAMKGPMKGAAVGHAKQQLRNGRYIGISEPGIIASESPNPIVNELLILPDIEKRLEAFVRLGHGFIVFPGGAGTAEEILFLLGVLMHPRNKRMPLPLIFAAPEEDAGYFEAIDRFICATLGEAARCYYRVMIGDPAAVAQQARKGIADIQRFRRAKQEAYYFNWLLHIEHAFQRPFIPSHENMASLRLDPALPPAKLAAQLRCAFSGIVAGNVKEEGIRAIEQNGPYQLKGNKALMSAMDDLLRSFADQGRMKLGGERYDPCYELVMSSDCD